MPKQKKTSRSESHAHVAPTTIGMKIKFNTITLAKIKSRLENEGPALRVVHANTVTGLMNELGRRWANGEVKL